MGIIGDIKGKTCIVNDDMIDTAGTLCASVLRMRLQVSLLASLVNVQQRCWKSINESKQRRLQRISNVFIFYY